MTSWDTITTTTCDIKRVGSIVAGHRPFPTTIYSGVICFIPYPVKPELKFYLGVKRSTKLLQTVIKGDYIIEENDVVVIGSGIYPVVTVENWLIRPTAGEYHILTMEEAV